VHCNTYYYALKTQDTNGNWSAMSNVLTLTQKCNQSIVICVEGGDAAVSVEPADALFLRVQSPVSGKSLVEFGLSPDADGGTLDAAVFDVTGRRVQTLESGTARSGSFSRVWNLDNADGSAVPAGLYFVRVVAGAQLMTERIVVVR
jgi:flagellar hook assembly protein FlgD